ncbi:tail completion or Neck1 protein [Vibrio phage D51]
MAFSAQGDLIVELAKGLFEDPDAEGKNTIQYKAEFRDNRSDATLMTLTYKLKKPITEEELDKDFATFFDKISKELGGKGSDVIASTLLTRQGFTKKDIQLSTQQGVMDVSFNEDIEEESSTGVNVGIQPKKGRLVSQLTMRNLLETVMKENMLAAMTSPSAGKGRDTILRNRTGRFVNTTNLDKLTVRNNGKNKKQTLSLYYKYMIYPYQVFDPLHTQSPQMNLASRARNPQRIIHTALAKAAKTLLGDRYTISIQQVL